MFNVSKNKFKNEEISLLKSGEKQKKTTPVPYHDITITKNHFFLHTRDFFNKFSYKSRQFKGKTSRQRQSSWVNATTLCLLSGVLCKTDSVAVFTVK